MGFRRYLCVLLIVAGSLVTGSAGAALAARPQSWRTVRFDGISLRVPAYWPVVNLARHPSACPRLDVHAVYLGTPGPHPLCPPGLIGRTEAVQIEPASPQSPDVREATRPVTLAGRQWLTNPDAAVTHTITDVLPSASVQVSLSYGTNRTLALRIGSTIRASAAIRTAPLSQPGPVRPASPEGLVHGYGFDTCAAPAIAAMNSWLASPYHAIGIYIGGVNRACAQASLSPAWISAIQAAGWQYFPLYPGLQASCVEASGDATINPAQAAAEGKAAADDAATQARALGIPPGTPLTYDMEAYAGCGAEVIKFLNAWDAELHIDGYSAGVYESFSNIGDLIGAAGLITEPDVIYYADWDGHATAWSSYMPTTMWTDHHRIHQYQGGHDERWGGVTMDVDNDWLNVNLGGGTAVSQADFRIAVGINANGSAEWFARAANGTLLHAYQHPVVSTTWSSVATVGDSPAGLVSNPAVAADADGSLTVFARDRAGQVLHAWQHPGAPDGWRWGGAVAPASMPAGAAGDPAAVRLPDGDVEVFTARLGGAIAVTHQVMPNGNAGWTTWTSIGGRCASSPAALVTGSNDVAVLCTTTAGTLAVDQYTGSAWSGWAAAGTSPHGLTGVPAVASDGAGQPEVFVATVTGGLAHAWQPAGTTGWTWGSVLAGGTTGATIATAPSATAWTGGEIAVFARLAQGQVAYRVQQGTAATAAWSRWISIGRRGVAMPAGWLNPSGTAEAAALGTRLRLGVASYSAGVWSDWTRLRGRF
jgi:Domain of unknown function (DUF1906)